MKTRKGFDGSGEGSEANPTFQGRLQLIHLFLEDVGLGGLESGWFQLFIGSVSVFSASCPQRLLVNQREGLTKDMAGGLGGRAATTENVSTPSDKMKVKASKESR